MGPVARQGSERHRGLRPGGCGRAPRLSVSCVCLKVPPGPPAGPWPRGRAPGAADAGGANDGGFGRARPALATDVRSPRAPDSAVSPSHDAVGFGGEKRNARPSPPARADGHGRPRESEALASGLVLGVRVLRGRVRTRSRGLPAGDRCGRVGGTAAPGRRVRGEVVQEGPVGAGVAHIARTSPRPAHTRHLRGRPRGHLPASRSVSGPPRRGQAGGRSAGSCCPESSGDPTPENPTRAAGWALPS